MMKASNLDENVCRICLQRNIILNWNEEILEFCGMTYKDCYYKYTRLEESDSNNFPTNLCEICANDLKNANLLFEKALDSFSILRAAFKSKTLKTDEYSAMEICSSQPTQGEVHTIDKSGSIAFVEEKNKDYNTLIETENELCLSNVCGNESIEENTINNAKEVSMSEYVTLEPGHFIDMQNFESSAEELQNESRDGEIKSRKMAVKNRRNYQLTETSMEQQLNLSCHSELAKLSKKKGKTVKLKKCQSLAQTSPERNIATNCYEASEMLTSTQDSKSRKKNPLMCAYCSLWVDGNTQLKLHEATHSEDRKRTVTCPHCGIKLYTKVALNCHLKIHDENRQKKHKCEFCEKAFYNRGGLNIHRRIHLGLMVKCPICSKEFYRQVDLNRHLPKHSATPLQKSAQQQLKYTVQCQYCNEYVRTDKWRGHKAAHLDQPQVKCKICDKNFFARTKCVRHLQRFHKKKNGYEEFIHYYVNYITRMSHLMIKQQEVVKPLK